MAKVKEIVKSAIENVISSEGFELLEVDYVKTHEGMELVVTIDKDGGVNISDCEKISRIIDPIVEELNPTGDQSYTLVVSSAGLDRPLTLERDFKRNMGKEIEITLYKKLGKTKVFTGELSSYSDEIVEITTAKNEKLSFKRSDIAHIVPVIKF